MDISELDIDFLSQVVSDNPRTPLFARLADVYLSRGRQSEAAQLCEAGIQYNPSYPTGYIVLGRCYLALNQPSKASEAFRMALALNPFTRSAEKLLASIPSGAAETQIEPEFVPAPAAVQEPAPETPEPVFFEPPIDPDLVVRQAASPEPAVAPEAVEETPLAIDTTELSLDAALDQAESTSAEMTAAGETPAEENWTSAAPVEPIADETPAVESANPVAGFEDTTLLARPETPTAETAAQVEGQFPGVDEYAEQQLAGTQPPSMSLDEYLSASGTTPAEGEDLGALAEKLENAGKIVPREEEPASEAQPEQAAAEPEIVSPTMAEIYASQGQYSAAIQVYEILMLSRPDEVEQFQKRIAELQQMLNEQDGVT